MLNPVYLRTFITLAETRHFTRTAEQLHMTQPGVSQHIKKLEQQLDKPLLHRFGKQFELTDAGEYLLRFGQRQAQEEQALRNYLEEDDSYSGECRLACSGAMALLLYPRLLEMQKAHPGLSFLVEAAPNQGIIERLQHNECELGIVTQQVTDPRLSQQQIAEDELCLVLPAGQSADWQQLNSLGFINHPDGHHYGNHLLQVNFPEQFSGMQSLRQSGFINQLTQILLPVSMGLGFTVLPRSAVNAFPHPERICVAELQRPVTETVYLTYKKQRPLGRRYDLVKQVLKGLW